MPRAVRWYWIGVALLLAMAALTAASLLHWGATIEAADASYGQATAAGCTPGSRPGRAGRHSRPSQGGLRYVVVTPRNYRADHRHPLLMVYAPAGFGAGLSERHAGLTQAATRAGYLLAYVGSGRPLSRDAVADMARIPGEVAAEWCIDASRIQATGHSDGGTVSLALATLPRHRGILGSIAVSGAGWQASDFAGIGCPPPLPVMILHGAEDSHFPGFGRETAGWWSRCNACSGSDEPDAGGCRRYLGCAAETVYCETPRSHWRWAGDPQQVVEFLSRSSSSRPTPTAPAR